MNKKFQKVCITLNSRKWPWVVIGVEQILYHCLKSICEPENLPHAVQFITEPYLPVNLEGKTVLFNDIKVHQ